jgi:dihydrofolate synthase / folylpolyglutamate synthase
MDNYQNVLDFLFSQLPMYQRIGKAAYKANLDTTIALDNYFNHPHLKFKTIHVAGTNGKGSVSHMLAAVLQKTGYKVGLYTSPHLIDFKERIKVNGREIDENSVTKFVNKHKVIIEKLSPSFFEMTVAMAFDYFEKEEIDVAVVEVGMGGRLDSTNIISPVLSVITNIGLDHTMFLGDTIEKIAKEKAGIIKEKIPLIVGESDPITSRVFNNIAGTKASPLIFADQYLNIEYTLQSINGLLTVNVKRDDKIIYENLKLDLLGAYQVKNMLTALTAICELKQNGFNISNKHVYEGFENCSKLTGLKGRWQIIGNNPLIVCDTGHNENGINAIVNQLKHTAYRKLHIVIGLVNDKNANSILQMLPKDAIYYFTKASIPRALDANILEDEASKVELHGEVFENVSTAFQSAKENADSKDLIFIGGSTFVVADLLKELK